MCLQSLDPEGIKRYKMATACKCILIWFINKWFYWPRNKTYLNWNSSDISMNHNSDASIEIHTNLQLWRICQNVNLTESYVDKEDFCGLNSQNFVQNPQLRQRKENFDLRKSKLFQYIYYLTYMPKTEGNTNVFHLLCMSGRWFTELSSEFLQNILMKLHIMFYLFLDFSEVYVIIFV